MGWAGYVCVALFVLAALALADVARVDFRFSRDGEDDQLSVRFRVLYGLVRYKLEVPVITFRLFEGLVMEEKLGNANQKKKLNSSKKKIGRREVLRSWRTYQLLLGHTLGFGDWLRRVLRQIRCGQLRWSTAVGAGSAPETAIAVGAVWAVKMSALGALLSLIRLEAQPEVAVQPDFQTATFKTSLQCQFKVRLGFIVYAAWLLVVRIVKVKGGVQTWRRILMKRRRAGTG